MAIKGKRRGRARSGRTVAVAPRPYLVRPKTPLMRRTGTKVALVVLVEALLFGFLVLGDAQSDAGRRREEVVEFTSLVEAQLYQGGVAQQSFTGPFVLPQLGQTVAEVEGGEFDAGELQQNTESWSDVATRAGEQIGDIDVELAGLKQARNLMEQGLLLYAQLARELGVAVQIDGAARRDLMGTIAEQMVIAGTIFDTGFGLLQEERRKAGLPTASGPPGGIPTDFGGLPPIPGGP